MTYHGPAPDTRFSSGWHSWAPLPMGFLFFATADWKRPLRTVRWLAFPGVAVVLALGILYYFESTLLWGLPIRSARCAAPYPFC